MCSKTLSSVFAAALVCVLASCIKEDRSGCPCYLTVDPTLVPSAVGGKMPATLEISGARDFRDSLLLDGETCAEPFVVPVPRPNVFVSVFAGAEDCFVPGEGIRIPPGSDCPGVYLYSARVVTDGEESFVKPLPVKQFCVLTVKIVPVNDVFLESFHLEISGSICGYHLDSRPAEGDFRCSAFPSGDGLCTARLPRQRDNSLMMQVMEGEAALRYFALGEYIAASGYDWTAENLEDIYLEIDYAATSFTVRVNGWETTVEYEVLI